MRTVHEVSKLTGVSVRTLHHYDAIGLLKPTKVTAAGYRLYDDAALRRLQDILLFRELQFPLKEIKRILDSPNFNPDEALAQQIGLLELQQRRIQELISFARAIQGKGGNIMNFDAFHTDEIDRYAAEVKEKWGSTQAYQEYEQNAEGKTSPELGKTANQLLSLFTELGALRQESPAGEAVQEKIGALQKFISDHYYLCTNEILRGLGQMYVADERMKRNIDKAGGAGTAEFARKAILAYCAQD